jgi:predicted dehydrogenase
MFNQRTDPFYLKIRQLIQGGELGVIRRINWIITTWFRPDAYYRSGGWRATWKGEGGGVLLNQSPHNLDLWQWLFGMPEEVWADCQLGRYHEIEVEDDVTAYLRYPGGTTGVFITSTGEAPGTNRLEIVAERGRLVYEDGRLTFVRNEQEMSAFSRTTTSPFSAPETWEVSIPLDRSNHGEQHVGILKNFIAAIREGAPLIAPAEEGIRSVELANAMLLSSARGAAVRLPVVSGEYRALLERRIGESTLAKAVDEKATPTADLSKSFAK